MNTHPTDMSATMRHEARRIERGALRIVRNWTLPVAMLTGTAAYLLFALVPALDGAAQVAGPLLSGSLPPLMFLTLFATFCKVDFRLLRPVGWHVPVLLLNAAATGLCLAAIVGLRLQGSALVLGESLLMCVVAPCATAAAVVTQKLGGSLEQTTTYTFLSNVLTAVVVPLTFPLVEKGGGMTFLAAFGAILWHVSFVLLLPMLAAYVVKHHLRGLHRRIVGLRDLSYYLWACTLAIVTGTTVHNILHARASAALLAAIALTALAVCAVQFAAGRATGSRYGHAQEAGQALGQKNTTFAIWIASVYLNPLSCVGPGCYILWQNIVNSIEIWHHRRRKE